jgi:4-hydroxy-tetrahydrodipicolinate synthase
MGADALLVVTPYYNKATQKGLKEHFKMVADSVKIPIILYNIPGRTGGVNILPETVKTLAEKYENIVAVKDATGNIGWTAKVAQLCGDNIAIYSGDDNCICPVLSLGGKGVISVLSHVAPRDTHLIVEKFLNGDTKGSLELQLKYLPMVDQLFCEVNPIPVKTACRFMGFKTGPLRSPLCEMEPAHAENLKAEMKKLGIIK